MTQTTDATAEQKAAQTAHELGDALRTLAAWIEDHPELAPHIRIDDVCAYPADTPETVREWARALKPCAKQYDDNSTSRALFRLSRDFGPFSLRAVFYRDAVCRKVIKGTREITRQIPDPAVMITVTETVEDVEWICDPILGDDGIEAVA